MDPVKIGNMIRQIREEKKLTQQQFANLFHVTYQAVSKWENGLNLPDLKTLKDICDTFNLDLEYFLNGNLAKKKKKMIYFFIPLLLIIIIVFILFFMKNDNFKLKEITADCENFEVSGGIAYNDNKTSLFIKDINYCGTKDLEVYEKIECSLYEQTANIIKKITTCEEKENITLDNYLNNLSFNVLDYKQTCKEYQNDSLYLEIVATNSSNKQTTYKIPLKLTSDCN